MVAAAPEASSAWWPWARGSAPQPAPAPSAPPASTPALSADAPVPPLPELDEPAAPLTVHLPLSTLLVSCAFGLGFVSGMVGGARRSGLMFLAENAHRLPRTVQGWYFYNKTKNYRMLLGGARQGTETGLHMAGWVGGFCLLDVMAEHARLRWAPPLLPRDTSESSALYLGHWSDGAFAGISTALVAAVACTCSTHTVRLPRPILLRVLFLGTAAGGTTGALRDVRQTLLEKSDPHRPHMV